MIASNLLMKFGDGVGGTILSHLSVCMNTPRTSFPNAMGITIHECTLITCAKTFQSYYPYPLDCRGACLRVEKQQRICFL